MKSTRRTWVAVATGSVALATGIAMMQPASAAPPSKSLLVATPGSLSIDYVASNPQTVTLELDNNCPNVYGHGQEFGIAASTTDAGIATVSPGSVNGMQCGDTQDFTVTGVSNGTVTLRFDAVAKNPGLQKKLGGVNVVTTVTNAPTGGDTGGPPPTHDRPAAPAVTNAYFDDPALLAACKDAYADAGHHWRGALIRTIAHWAAANHLGKAKDDLTQFPTDNSWIKYVQAKVDDLCGYTPPTV
jgi:hypothetical protein